jgi:hypothetical protein
MRVRWSPAAVLTLCVATACAGDSTGGQAGDPGAAMPVEPAAAPVTRNPFGLPDVAEPGDEEVRKFADEAPALGDPSDPNAEAWATLAGDSPALDGKWESRWNVQNSNWMTGTATVRTVGETVYIHYVDTHEYLIEARREGDRFVGRYRTVVGEETSPWVATIVSPTRIDGWWAGGRWDLRRADAGPSEAASPKNP